jgi:hypothetical protein
MAAARVTSMTGSPNRSEIIRPVVLRMSHRPSQRRMPTSCGTASPRSASPAPIASSARSPLGARASATPTGSSDAARSQAVTSQPAAYSPAAAARPPIPAPITTARARATIAPRSAHHNYYSP